MRGSLSIAALYLAVASSTAPAEEAVKLDDENARINYSIVYQVGDDFQRQGMDLDQALVIKGIEDAFSGAKPALTPAEMRKALAGLRAELRQKIFAEKEARAQEQAEAQRKAGEAFLTANKAKDGVKVTASGLQYKVIEPGSGSSPSARDTVKVHYRGTRIDGTEFDSSYKRGEPAEFRLDSVIKGWAEGLQLMKEGAKYKLYIPPQLAYGDRGRLAHQILVFEVELLSVVEPAE